MTTSTSPARPFDPSRDVRADDLADATETYGRITDALHLGQFSGPVQVDAYVLARREAAAVIITSALTWTPGLTWTGGGEHSCDFRGGAWLHRLAPVTNRRGAVVVPPTYVLNVPSRTGHRTVGTFPTALDAVRYDLAARPD